MFCNICGYRSFSDFNGRLAIRCEGCGSLERHRLFALLAIDCLDNLNGRKIHLVAPAKELTKITAVAPHRFVINAPSAILAAEHIDALFMRNEFEAFNLPVDRLFAELRRKMMAGGLVGFTCRQNSEGPPCVSTKFQVSETTTEERFEFGPGAHDWFNSLPGWSASIWSPKSSFGAGADKEMVLNYKEGKFPSNRIILARAV